MLVLGTGVVMRNSLYGIELIEWSVVSVSTPRRPDQGACGSRALPQLLRARHAPSTRSRNGRRHQAVTDIRARHGTCAESLEL